MRQPVKHLRVGVVGSRGFKPLSLVADTVENLGRCVIVSGGAPGVDSIAEWKARKLGYPEPDIYPANWKKFGKPAGMIRNRTIVENAEGFIVFWDGKSPGTKGIIGIIRKTKKPMILIQKIGDEVRIENEGWDPTDRPWENDAG